MANFQPAANIEYDGRLLNGTDLLYDTTQGVRIWGNPTQDNYSIGDTTTGGVDSTYGNNNLAFGQFALNATALSSKQYNIAIGSSVFQSLGGTISLPTSGSNIGMGLNVAKLVPYAINNILLGKDVLKTYSSTTVLQGQTIVGALNLTLATSVGLRNTVIGSNNLQTCTDIGTYNVVIGSAIGESITSGNNSSVFIGGQLSTTGSYLPGNSVTIGYSAGSNGLTTGGKFNTFIGYSATATDDSTYTTIIGANAAGTSQSTIIGASAGATTTTGLGNIIIGYNSGGGLTTGIKNIIIGHSRAAQSATSDNNIDIVTHTGSGATITVTNLNSVGNIITCNSTTLTVGQPISVSGTFTNGSIVGHTGTVIYYIISTNGSTTFSLSGTPGGTSVTLTSGTGAGPTFTTSGPTGFRFTTGTGTISLLAPLVNMPSGRLLINGTTSDDNIPVQISPTINTTSTTNIYTYYHTPSINPINTNLTGNVIGINIFPKYISNFIPNSGASHYSAAQITAGSTSALTTAIPDVRGLTIAFQPGFYAATVAPVEYTHIRLADPTLNGSTATYNIYSGSNTSTGKWNLYLIGTSPNHILSKVLLGSTTDSGTGEILQVTGTALISSNLKVAGTQINTSTQANTAWLATGTANSTTFLRGDGTWATVTGTSVTPSIARTFALMGA